MADDPWAEFRTPAPSVSGGSTGDAAGDPWAAFREQASTPAPAGPRFDVAGTVRDVAQQIPAGLVTGTEAIPAFPAQAAGFLGGLADKVLPSSWISPEAQQQQQAVRDLATTQRGGGIAQYLPEAKTEFGKSVRSIMEFVPATVTGTALSVPRAVGVGLTAGAGSEALGRATEGSEAEPYARAFGGLVAGTVGLRRAERAAAAEALPNLDELRRRAGIGYEAVKQSGLEIRPEAAANFSQRIKNELTQAGLDENLAGKTWGILDKLDNAPPGATMTAQNFQSLRKTLGNAAGSLDPQERLAAVMAKNKLDDFLGNLTPAETLAGDPQRASALLREANANYAAAERAAALDKRITAAELRASSTHSGMNLENTIRQRMAQVLTNPAMQRGYSPQELAEMARIVRGGNIGNVGRYARQLLGGGGGLGALAAGGAGGAVNYAFGGDPTTGAVVAPAAGAALAILGNRATLARARALEQMVRSRSPLAGQTALPPPMGAAPLAFLPPALSSDDEPLRVTVTPGNRTLATLGQ